MEGTRFKVFDAVLISTVLTFFLAVAIALIVINADVLFRDIEITVFAFVFVAILLIIIAVVCSKYYPIYKKRKFARKVIKNCTLTDGTVIDLVKQKMWHTGVNTASNYSYYAVYLRYSFHDLDGNLRYGELRGNYGEVPFFTGQNLMVAFNGTQSVILSKFSLSEGAEEFARAEAEREQPDFSGLTGKPIKVKQKPVAISYYGQTRLNRILSSNPRFTEGRYFIKKSTYRYNSGNNKFYCFIDAEGKKHVKECKVIEKLKDGDQVVVAYGGGISEIIKTAN